MSKRKYISAKTAVKVIHIKEVFVLTEPKASVKDLKRKISGLRWSTFLLRFLCLRGSRDLHISS